MLSRRDLIAKVGAASFAFSSLPSMAATSAPTANLGFAGGEPIRPLSGSFPQKGTMILQRTRPPLLETPFEVFDSGVFTPNDRFFVRWHWAIIPQSVDASAFRLMVRGHVNKPLSLTLDEIASLPRVEVAAVNQCAGNSRGFFQPRVLGAQWGNGAMGNAKWTGVKLRDVLDRAGIKSGAVAVRFGGMDEQIVPDAPDFMKSLSVDHARDGEVMIAYAMNGKPLPLLNGFPLRLVVPGWFSTYWVKMLNDIEVLDKPDTGFWTATAYKIPDNIHADMRPGQAGVRMVPVTRMLPRSFITNVAPHASLSAAQPVVVRGVAMGGDCGVKSVELSTDEGRTWNAANLGRDEGTHSFRGWSTRLRLDAKGPKNLLIRCTNTKGESQPMKENWNPGGYLRNVVESVPIVVT